MELSIVTTLYESSSYIEEFYDRISAAAANICRDYEIIFVNDGSPDDSLQKAIGLYERDPRVRLIDLSRNFGQQKAIMTGLAHARGSLIFLTDADLEEEPELLHRFHQELLHSGGDVVYGVQKARKGGWFERLSGWLFFAIFNLFSSEPIPRNLVATRLMTARYVRALLQHQEREVALSGLFATTGFDQKPIPITKRNKGRTSYTFSSKVAILLDSITAFSNKPLIYSFYLGTFLTFLSGALGLYLVVRQLFFSTMASGWPSLMVSIWFFGGLMIFCLSLIGLYISKIFVEIKQRPYTIIQKTYERNESP